MEVGVPKGARAVNCRSSVGRASTSATADGGRDKVDAQTRFFTIQLRRENCELLADAFVDSAVHPVAAKKPTNDNTERNFMGLISRAQFCETSQGG